MKRTNDHSKKIKENSGDKLPSETMNGNFSARPHELDELESHENAKASGYTDAAGNAISMADKDEVRRPTGAYTDIDAGSSRAVISKHGYLRNQHIKH